MKNIAARVAAAGWLPALICTCGTWRRSASPSVGLLGGAVAALFAAQFQKRRRLARARAKEEEEAEEGRNAQVANFLRRRGGCGVSLPPLTARVNLTRRTASSLAGETATAVTSAARAICNLIHLTAVQRWRRRRKTRAQAAKERRVECSHLPLARATSAQNLIYD